MTPVWINNRNRLTTTRAMVEYLAGVPGALPIIVDNASTYPPLLEWYAQYKGEVIRLNENLGPWAPWIVSGDLARGNDYYVVTDSDLDLAGVPVDVLEKLRDGLEKHPDMIKTGLSLEINDLPSWQEIGLENNHEWESAYWRHKTEDGWWIAITDTTFAMYRRGWHSAKQAVGPARADRPYTARHVPWYRIRDDEELYYEAHADFNWASTVKMWNERSKTAGKAYRPPAGPTLPVTLACIDCLEPELAAAALRTGDGLPFARRVLFSHERPENLPEHIEWMNIEPIRSVREYSLFCIERLKDYIDTPHVLTVQADGYILRPELWQNAWLQYDYVASPWPSNLSVAEFTQVGNSGFCLRSKRWLETVAAVRQLPEYEDQWSDDLFPCHRGYKELVARGMQFAPLAAVERFSMEQPIESLSQSLGLVFGYHGRLTADTRQLSDALVSHTFKDLFLRLIVNYRNERAYDRAVEIDECLRANCGPGLFNEVLAIVPAGAHLPCYRRLRHAGAEQPTFADMIQEVNARTKNMQVNILADSDIEFDPATIALFRRIRRDDFWCLSPWDNTGEGGEFKPPSKMDMGRQHAWAWRGRCRIEPAAANFRMQQPGAASHLASLARQAGYQLANPSLSVKSFHVHADRENEFCGAEVQRPYTRIPPHKAGVPLFVH